MGGDPRDFTGRAVAVTGGTKGIGRALAEAFLTAGAEVTVCGRTAPSAPPRAGGRTAHVMCADVRDPAAAREFVDAAARRSGRLDVLVNNAGGSPDADAATVSPRFVEKVVALNLLAPFYASQAAHRHMHGQDGGGCILNIGSVSAHHPQPGTAAYSAAKAGLLMLTRALALEWGPAVRVNHLSAGPVRTAPQGRSARRPSPGSSRWAAWRSPPTSPTPASTWRARRPGTSTARIWPSTAAANRPPAI